MNRCIRCRKLEAEPAGEGCGNPAWHAGYTSESRFAPSCAEVGHHCLCHRAVLWCCACETRRED